VPAAAPFQEGITLCCATSMATTPRWVTPSTEVKLPPAYNVAPSGDNASARTSLSAGSIHSRLPVAALTAAMPPVPLSFPPR
jgi:hypothetical protein